MRNARLWHALLGVEKTTVIEGIEFDEDAELLVAHVRPARGRGAAVGCAGAAARGMTAVRAGAAGGRWIWARCGRCSRPTRRG